MRKVAVIVSIGMLLAACATDDTESQNSESAVEGGTVGLGTIDTSAAGTAVPTTALPSTSPTSTSAPVSTESAGEPPGADLVGHWAHYDVVAYQEGDMKTLIVSYGLDDFAEVDGQIIDTTQFCFSEQRTNQPIEIFLSDAATQAIKPPPTPVDVDVVDDVLRIRRAATPTPVGIRLDDPANETLPEDPDDPRIVDDDGDGHPGITVTIQVGEDLTGELYIARREIFAYEALLVDEDTLSGVVTDGSEQLIIGVSDPIFSGSGADWEQYPDLSESPIILKRVTEEWDCDRLAAERDALFPPTPEIDW
jgi:hypothetical protein